MGAGRLAGHGAGRGGGGAGRLPRRAARHRRAGGPGAVGGEPWAAFHALKHGARRPCRARAGGGGAGVFRPRADPCRAAGPCLRDAGGARGPDAPGAAGGGGGQQHRRSGAVAAGAGLVRGARGVPLHPRDGGRERQGGGAGHRAGGDRPGRDPGRAGRCRLRRRPRPAGRRRRPAARRPDPCRAAISADLRGRKRGAGPRRRLRPLLRGGRAARRPRGRDAADRDAVGHRPRCAGRGLGHALDHRGCRDGAAASGTRRPGAVRAARGRARADADEP